MQHISSYKILLVILFALWCFLIWHCKHHSRASVLLLMHCIGLHNPFLFITNEFRYTKQQNAAETTTIRRGKKISIVLLCCQLTPQELPCCPGWIKQWCGLKSKTHTPKLSQLSLAPTFSTTVNSPAELTALTKSLLTWNVQPTSLRIQSVRADR